MKHNPFLYGTLFTTCQTTAARPPDASEPASAILPVAVSANQTRRHGNQHGRQAAKQSLAVVFF
jgi:hypothetical protein